MGRIGFEVALLRVPIWAVLLGHALSKDGQNATENRRNSPLEVLKNAMKRYEHM